MMELIKKIADELKIPVLCNIHNIELAKQFANKILGLQDGKKKFDDVTENLPMMFFKISISSRFYKLYEWL